MWMKQVACRALSFAIGLGSCVGVCSAAGIDEGMALLDAPALSGSGLARPRAAELDPRAIGSVFFLWDSVAEGGVGWQNNVTQGEYVQAFDVNGTLIEVVVCGVGNAPGVDAVVAGVVYEDDGPGGSPGTLLSLGEGSLIPGPQTSVDCTRLSVPAVERSGRTFVGARWIPSQDQGFFVAYDNSGGTAIADMYGRGKTGAPAGNWNLVRDTSPTVRALGIGARVVSMAQATAPCVDSANVLCLNFGRFRTELRFRQPDDQEGLGTDSGLRTDDSATLWFFNADNLEMLVKVLDACIVNNHYWVFFAATTNVEFAMTVTDTQAGKVRTYFNPLNRPAPPIQDTSAFATCP